MDQNTLTAVSPVDGRYKNKVENLWEYFSEFALIKYRVFVEVEYFIALCELPLPQLEGISKEQRDKLRTIHQNFSVEQAARVKEIERVTNHDVKAVEYFMKEKFDQSGLEKYKEFIHFGLTSQDINNTALPLSIHHALAAEYDPLLKELTGKLEALAEQ